MAATTAFTQAVTTSIMSWSTLELLVVNLTTFDKCHASLSSVYKCPKVVGPLYLLSLFNILKNLTLFCPVLWKHKIYCVILLPAVLGDFMGLRSLERWRWLKLNSLSGLLLPCPYYPHSLVLGGGPCQQRARDCSVNIYHPVNKMVHFTRRMMEDLPK